LGSDDFGNSYYRGLEGEGMDLRFLRRTEAQPSGVALIFVAPDGENVIAVAPGANDALTAEDVDAAEEAFRDADAVLLQLEVPLAAVRRAAEWGRRFGARVVLNPAPAPSEPLPTDLLALVDVLTPNEHEILALTGICDDPRAAIRGLREAGVGAVTMTLGADGALLVSGDGEAKIPGRKVEAVDATGAGDCFNGALTTALAEGLSLEDAARWATVAASISVTRMGAQPSLPMREETDAAFNAMLR
jgi:ribokinase